MVSKMDSHLANNDFPLVVHVPTDQMENLEALRQTISMRYFKGDYELPHLERRDGRRKGRRSVSEGSECDQSRGGR